jgi:DNA-binding beta-propeller fold protein YncE
MGATTQVSIRAWLAGILLALLAAVAPSPATAATAGGLKQLTGTKGCIVDEASVPTGCEDVRAMQNIGDVAVSPDGENAYVTSIDRDAIVVFDRDATTGALTQKPSITGCVTSNPGFSGPDSCNLVAPAEILDGAHGVAVSPDGANVYVASAASGRLTGFNRAGDGTLTLNNFSNFSGSSHPISSVAVSPDGATVYLGGTGNGGQVAQYRREPGGAITFINCWAVSACPQSAPNLGPVRDVEVSPDNKELLVATGAALLGWDRVTAAGPTQGNLTPSGSVNRCVSATTLSGTCQAQPAMVELRNLAFADGGARLLVASDFSLSQVNRNPTTNDLAPDTTGNCFSYPASVFAGCTPVPGGNCCTDFYPAREVAATPNGDNVYLGTKAPNPNIYGLESTGAMSLIPAPLGCTNPSGAEGCATFRQGVGVEAMATAPNNRHLYAGGNNRLFSFAIDRPPTCANVSAEIDLNTAGPVQLSCTDPDGDALTYEIVSQPAKGSLGGVQGSSVTYGPFLGTSGTDTFTYRARGAGIASDPATATVTVGESEACLEARTKLKKAKKKLKKLKKNDAPAAKLKKAKKKVKKAKKAVKKACG